MTDLEVKVRELLINDLWGVVDLSTYERIIKKVTTFVETKAWEVTRVLPCSHPQNSMGTCRCMTLCRVQSFKHEFQEPHTHHPSCDAHP